MIRKSFLLCSTLALFAIIGVGCGGNVDEGVADAPDEEVELTEEEVAGEEEAYGN